MINVTDRPIVIVEGEELNSRIRLGIKTYIDALDEAYGFQEQLNKRKRIRTGFGRNRKAAGFRYFSLDKLLDIQYGDSFIQALADIAIIGSRNKGISEASNRLNQFLTHEKCLPVNLIAHFKVHVKLLLLSLWKEKAIILPYKFLIGGGVFENYQPVIYLIESEVAAFFRKYKTDVNFRNPSAYTLPKTGADSLYKYGARVIWATDYHRFEDVNVVEICQLHHVILNDIKLNGGFTPPVILMLRELLNHHPDRVGFLPGDVDALMLWLNGRYTREYAFEDYLIRREQISKEIDAKRIASKLSRSKYKSRKKLTSSDLDDANESYENNDLLLLSLNEDHESIVEYFGKLRGAYRNGLEWLRFRAPYRGREHIDLKPISSLWLEAWTAWLNYRKKVQNFDSEDSLNSSFNLFCDYLFLYLPWWKELFPDNKVKVPLSPNQLKRSVFIHRTELFEGEPVSIDKMPLTFLDILPNRRTSPDSRYAAINHLIQFLDWVEIGFEDDERIAGKSYRNPLNSIDLPKVRKKTKTTKVPFSKRVYPHLLFYTYAIEAFGEYLQILAMERPALFEGKSIRQHRFLSTGPLPEQVSDSGAVSEEYLENWPENFGYVPYISYRGKNYPIYRLPDVYQWAARKINLERYHIKGGIATYWLPHLTILRMLIGAIETGLRLQSLQWLDLRKWDLINKRNGVPVNYNFSMTDYQNGHFALPLFISTDKTKEDAWDVLTVFRIRSCFHREQYFRDSIVEEEMDTPVDYDGIKNSRFGQIVPLFRSHNSPKPVSDNLYSSYWIHLLWGFEEYFDTNVSADNEFVQFVYLKGTDEVQVPDYSETNPKSLLAINTPHACRATYATNRTGTLEVSDVARQLGHSNTIVTMHYTVSTPENVAEKLLAVEREIQAEFQQYNSRSAYIRADVPDSSLYKNFQVNRTEAIDAFQFAPSIALWSTEELTSDLNGIEMLKNSPMSQIRFRETHICPVGEACPEDILVKIGEPLRCGICPLAMRCVDHLPAIASKINQLKMNIRTNIRRAEKLANRNEPDSSVDPLYEAAEVDANELVGWQFSHDILLKMLELRTDESQGKYHIQSPDIVKKHLQMVTTNRTVSEFFLQRIVDANSFPSMADPQIQLVADRYCRYILSGKYQPSIDDDPVTTLAGLLKTHMEPYGLTISDLAEKIDQYELAREQGHPMLSSNPEFLLTDSQGAE